MKRANPEALPVNWLVRTRVEKALRAAAPKYFRGRLIDIGCGIKPYGELLAPYVDRHIGVDHPGTSHDRSSIDLYGTAYDLPVRDASFESALCTAVLEHVEDPQHALRECFRILVPGGHAVYTVPFIWHLHEEPRDFFRFSKYGLHHLFEKAGFGIVELSALSGFWGTFGQLFAYNLERVNRGILRRLRIVDAAELLVQGAAVLLDRIDRTEQWTWMYLVVARKP